MKKLKMIFLGGVLVVNSLAMADGPTEEELKKQLDSQGRPKFMHSETFDLSRGAPYGRKGTEIEAAFTLKCENDSVEKRKLLYEKLREDEWDKFKEIRKCKSCTALTSGYDIDTIPWTSSAHEIRESSPYVWLTVEGAWGPAGRYSTTPDSTLEGTRYIFDPKDSRPYKGKNEVSMGTDLMDDYYLDTKDYLLLDNKHTLRARKRWDSFKAEDDAILRRILIACKQVNGVDPETGIKKDLKCDSRLDVRDPNNKQVKYLLANTIRGYQYRNNDTPATFKLYQNLKEAKVLPDVGKWKGVLLLEPRAFLRSLRSRYHLNETDTKRLVEFYQNAFSKLSWLENETELLLARKEELKLGQETVNALEELKGLASPEKVRETIVAGLEDEISTLDVKSLDRLITEPSANDEDELAKIKLLSEKAYKVLHEIGNKIDESKEFLTLDKDWGGDNEDYLEWFKEWRISKLDNKRGKDSRDSKKELPNSQQDKKRTLTTYFYWYGEFNKILKDANFAELLKELNAFGAQEKTSENRLFRDFEEFTEENFKRLYFAFMDELIPVLGRQVEAGGTAAKGLWFETARRIYAPYSYRNTGNILIDTIDVTGMFRPKAWEGVPFEKQTNKNEPNIDEVFHATLVNEVQIELGSETGILNTLNAIKYIRALFAWQDEKLGSPVETSVILDLVYKWQRIWKDKEFDKTVKSFNEFLEKKGELDSLSFQSFRNLNLDSNLRLRNRHKLDRVDLLKSLEQQYKGVKWMFDQYLGVLPMIARFKQDGIAEVMEDIGGGLETCKEMEAAEYSKGETALRKLRELDK